MLVLVKYSFSDGRSLKGPYCVWFDSIITITVVIGHKKPAARSPSKSTSANNDYPLRFSTPTPSSIIKHSKDYTIHHILKAKANTRLSDPPPPQFLPQSSTYPSQIPQRNITKILIPPRTKPLSPPSPLPQPPNPRLQIPHLLPLPPPLLRLPSFTNQPTNRLDMPRQHLREGI